MYNDFERERIMDKVKVGDSLTIHCYKHNGILHRVCEDAQVLEITENCLVCANYKRNSNLDILQKKLV